MRNWCIAFIVIAILNLVGNTVRVTLAFIAGERLTFRLRKSVFESILHQRPAWFDEPIHGSSRLTQRLAADAPQVEWSECGSMVACLVITFYF